MKKWIILAGILVVIGALFMMASRFLNESGGWDEKVTKALQPTKCVPAPEKHYGSLRYTGPLIDTHYHIPHMDSPPPWMPNRGWPLMGSNITIGDIACTIRQEKTKKIFAFFPVFAGEHVREFLNVAHGAVSQHSDILVPFIMPPGDDNSPGGFPTVTADELRTMLAVYPPGLFQGYGEIGLYARQGGAAALPPDSPRFLDIYPLIRENKLAVYFHLGENQQESFERILEQNSDINFIFHGDQLIPGEQDGIQDLSAIETIIRRHPNVFYTIDELYGNRWMIKPEVSKKEFLAYLENYEELLDYDSKNWKWIIEKYPDQFMWGTDRSDQVRWSHDPEVGQALTGYARAFIARLSPTVQEKFAYKNAERVVSRQ